jgi:transcriptional regulator with AAA-type ATPase domain
MNQTDKLNLERIIKENNVEDCTNEIRAKKHSSLIKSDVDRMLHLKKTHGNIGSLDEMIDRECSFLFMNYTDIFNKLKKDELNVCTLFEFLEVLKTIEDGELNQHEGAYKIGKLLKKLYIDSALVHAKRLDEKSSSDKTTGSTETEHLPDAKDISWKNYKKTIRKNN